MKSPSVPTAVNCLALCAFVFATNLSAAEHVRRLPLQGASNFRDLGGNRTAEGKAVRWGLVYRSDHLVGLTVDVQAVNARGKFMIPGLWDMHVHIMKAERTLPLFVANGITGVRNMGGIEKEVFQWR